MRHAFVIALIALVPLVADAKPKKGKGKGKGKGNAKVEFKVHLDKGTKAHKAGKYDEALTELQAAYAIDPQPKLLFAIGQVHAKLDNCPEAVASYEKFLESEKNKKKATVVKQAIEACNKKIAAATPPPPPEPPAAEPSPPPAETPPPPAEAPLPDPVPDSDSPFGDNPKPVPVATTTTSVSVSSGGKPWYKDVVGDALVVGGIAAGALSVVMYTGARGTLDEAEKAATLTDYERKLTKADDQRTYAVVFAGAGAVLITAGILRYKLRDKGETRGVAIAPTSGGGMVTWSGGF